MSISELMTWTVKSGECDILTHYLAWAAFGPELLSKFSRVSGGITRESGAKPPTAVVQRSDMPKYFGRPSLTPPATDASGS